MHFRNTPKLRTHRTSGEGVLTVVNDTEMLGIDGETLVTCTEPRTSILHTPYRLRHDSLLSG